MCGLPDSSALWACLHGPNQPLCYKLVKGEFLLHCFVKPFDGTLWQILVFSQEGTGCHQGEHHERTARDTNEAFLINQLGNDFCVSQPAIALVY